MAGIPWTKEELAYLEDNWGSFKSDHQEKVFIYRLSEVSGNLRTREAIDSKALNRGLTKRDSMGLPTLGEMARQLEVNPTTLQKFIAKRGLEVLKTSCFVFIPPATQAEMERFYARPSKALLEETLSTEEAARRLNVVQKEIHRLIQFGALEGVRDRRVWRVTKLSLYRAMSLRNIHGSNWLAKLKGQLSPKYHQDRAYARKAIAYSRMFDHPEKALPRNHASILALAPLPKARIH